MNDVSNFLAVTTLPALALALTALRWTAVFSFGILAVMLTGERADRALALAAACATKNPPGPKR